MILTTRDHDLGYEVPILSRGHAESCEKNPLYALCSSEASSWTRARNSRGLTPFTALNCREK
jgi:hypothetical protein